MLAKKKTPIFLQRGPVVKIKSCIFLQRGPVVKIKSCIFLWSGIVVMPTVSRSSKSRQDAEVVTLLKGKGACSNPSNYQGIFLLDVVGKVLATVIERRLKRVAEFWLDDNQNWFTEKCSTSMSIHVLCRTQEACHSADLKALAFFFLISKKPFILLQGMRSTNVCMDQDPVRSPGHDNGNS
jgi:hypothetical protein